MSWIQRLERRLEPYAITNLTLFLVIGQTFLLLTSMLGLIDLRLCVLVPALVQAGEWWRLFTFVFIPPPASPLFVAFALYLLFLYGSALERFWGALRFNLFLLTGWALTVGLSFVTPFAATTNIFIAGLVFLAFARLNPNFELLLFFVLPVKVKWLALIQWIFYGYYFAIGGLSTKLAVLAAVVNFLIFFADDIVRALRQRGRRPPSGTRGATSDNSLTEARHTCAVCGRTEQTNPELDFRYAADDQCYCTDHLPNRKPAATSGEAPSH
jgi:hypothetical protein